MLLFILLQLEIFKYASGSVSFFIPNFPLTRPLVSEISIPIYVATYTHTHRKRAPKCFPFFMTYLVVHLILLCRHLHSLPLHSCKLFEISSDLQKAPFVCAHIQYTNTSTPTMPYAWNVLLVLPLIPLLLLLLLLIAQRKVAGNKPGKMSADIYQMQITYSCANSEILALTLCD